MFGKARLVSWHLLHHILDGIKTVRVIRLWTHYKQAFFFALAILFSYNF